MRQAASLSVLTAMAEYTFIVFSVVQGGWMKTGLTTLIFALVKLKSDQMMQRTVLFAAIASDGELQTLLGEVTKVRDGNPKVGGASQINTHKTVVLHLLTQRHIQTGCRA